MKKNGFISTTLIYSFFLVFLMLLLLIVNNLISERILLKKVQNQVKDDITNEQLSTYLIENIDTLVHHDNTLEHGANDDSYRFVGATPNNYVCFASSGCTDDNNLYRIIGVFDGRVKVVKYQALNLSAWNEVDTYKLNTSILNEDYLNTLSTDLINKIDYVRWYNGGVTSDNNNPKSIYDEEITESKYHNAFLNIRVGLPYVSDYGFASSNYDTIVSNNNNWLFKDSMWTFSKNKDIFNQAFYVKDDGTLESDYMFNEKNVYPTFYLKRAVAYAGGNGSKTNPYKIR